MTSFNPAAAVFGELMVSDRAGKSVTKNRLSFSGEPAQLGRSTNTDMSGELAVLGVGPEEDLVHVHIIRPGHGENHYPYKRIGRHCATGIRFINAQRCPAR